MREIFNTAYRDALRLLQQMWTRIVLLFALAFIGGLAGGFVSLQIHTQLGIAVVELLAGIAVGWLVAPCFVALYRFVETGDRTMPAWGAPATRQFFYWTAVTNFIVAAPGLLLIVVRDLSSDDAYQRLDQPLTIASYFVLLVFVLRVVTLLPSAAAGRRTDMRTSLAESRGHFWFILGAFLLTTLPPIIASFVLAVVLVLIFGSDNAAVVFVPFGLAAIFLMLVGISVGSQLSRKLALPEPAP